MENNERKNNSLTELMEASMSKIRDMVDSNTIIGEPIQTPDGVTLIPVSRLSFGFGCGGGDYGKQAPKFQHRRCQGGAGGFPGGEGRRHPGDARGPARRGHRGPGHRPGAPGHGPGGEFHRQEESGKRDVLSE